MKNFTPFLSIFCFTSLGAVIAGVIGANHFGVPNSIVLRNIGAWLVGMGFALLMVRFLRRPRFEIIVIIAIFALGLSFVNNGLSGVHRWIKLGSLNFNAAQLFLPLGIVAIHNLKNNYTGFLLSSATISILLALQPDKSQICAFLFALIAGAFAQNFTIKQNSIAIFISLICAIFAFSIPENLYPVPEVEGIIMLINNVSPILGGFALICLILSNLSPIALIIAAKKGLRAAILAIVAYSLIATIFPIFLPFPVPLIGMSVSPIIGSWLAIGLLCNLANGMENKLTA